MSEPFSAQERPPFNLEDLRNRDVAADTLGGLALSRTLQVLPESDISASAIADTASAESTQEVLERLVFLRTMADTLVSNTLDDVPLTPARARQLGICVAAIAIERAAWWSGTYGIDAFADDVMYEAEELDRTGAAKYRKEDRPDVWARALYMLQPEARQRLAEMLMAELRHQVDGYTIQQAASEALSHLVRMGEGPAEGSGAAEIYSEGDYSVRDVATEGQAIAMLTSDSPFARVMHEALRDEHDSDPHLTPEALYEQGINRVLAYVAVGTERLAAQTLPNNE